MSCLITMSQKELHRLEVIQKIRDERLSVVQAAELLDLSRSQVHLLLQAYDRDGPAGLVSKKRSQPSNRRHSEEFRNKALDLIRECYLDLGPTLAREKLIELHRISVAKETLRQWMTEAGIWIARRERKKRVFQPHGRRDCFGELVQIVASVVVRDTDLATISQRDLIHLARHLNDQPRKCLGYKTPAEVFMAHLQEAE